MATTLTANTECFFKKHPPHVFEAVISPWECRDRNGCETHSCWLQCNPRPTWAHKLGDQRTTLSTTYNIFQRIPGVWNFLLADLPKLIRNINISQKLWGSLSGSRCNQDHQDDRLSKWHKCLSILRIYNDSYVVNFKGRLHIIINGPRGERLSAKALTGETRDFQILKRFQPPGMDRKVH